MKKRLQYRLSTLCILLLLSTCAFGAARWWCDRIPSEVRLAQQALKNLVASDSSAFRWHEGDLDAIQLPGEDGFDRVHIGSIEVDVEAQTYRFSTYFGSPDSGFGVSESYRGTFTIRKDGTWQATTPMIEESWEHYGPIDDDGESAP